MNLLSEMTADVLISTQDRVGRIRLNRPKAIHALNTAMCEAISAALLGWMHDDSVEAVVLGGTELALILTEPAYVGVPILNTAQIHVDAAIDWLNGRVDEDEAAGQDT